jgi:hypothetical protein
MLTLVPESWFSWDFSVIDDSGDVVLIDRHWFRENASFSVNGRSFDVRRTSLVRGTFALEHAGVTVAEARKPSSFRRAFDITTGADHYRLEAANVFGRAFVLSHDGIPVGGVRPTSFIGRTATAQFPEQLPPEIQLFIVFLVLILWKRAADAAAAS